MRPPCPYQKMSPKALRQRALEVWTSLDAAGVYVPPLPEKLPDATHGDIKKDKFHLERHGHGRGNTKSIKRRSRREAKETLVRLIVHLEDLAASHKLCTAGIKDEDGGGGSSDVSSTSSEDSLISDIIPKFCTLGLEPSSASTPYKARGGEMSADAKHSNRL